MTHQLPVEVCACIFSYLLAVDKSRLCRSAGRDRIRVLTSLRITCRLWDSVLRVYWTTWTGRTYGGWLHRRYTEKRLQKTREQHRTVGGQQRRVFLLLRRVNKLLEEYGEDICAPLTASPFTPLLLSAMPEIQQRLGPAHKYVMNYERRLTRCRFYIRYCRWEIMHNNSRQPATNISIRQQMHLHTYRLIGAVLRLAGHMTVLGGPLAACDLLRDPVLVLGYVEQLHTRMAGLATPHFGYSQSRKEVVTALRGVQEDQRRRRIWTSFVHGPIAAHVALYGVPPKYHT